MYDLRSYNKVSAVKDQGNSVPLDNGFRNHDILDHNASGRACP